MRRLAAAAAVAAVAAAAVLLLARGGGAPAIAPASPIAARAAFERPFVAFGDPFDARVVVTLDRSVVRPQTLHVADDLAPLTTLAARTTTRTVSGRLETVTITRRVACLTDPCLARTITVPPVRVSVATRTGQTSALAAPWRRLHVRSRVTAADVARSTPRFAADIAPGRPAYRVDPATAASALAVVAALAAAGAAVLLALEALAFARRRRHAVAGDELARALRLVREAEQRPVPDRRRALALLARLLRRTDGALGRTASDLAWSEPAPARDAVDELVTRVERERAG